MNRPRLGGWQIVAIAAAAAVVVAGKQFYRGASPAELAWLIAPVARLAGLATGTHFAYEAGLGWVSRDAQFVIAPVCAGLNFALAAFLALVIAWLPAMRGARAAAGRLVTAAVVAYLVATIVNTVRIVLALETHATGAAHEVLGVVVYLGALCALYSWARERSRDGLAA